MIQIVLRGRVNDEGKIELIDPLPDDFDRSKEVEIVLKQDSSVYETIDDYGNRVIVDEINGSVTPVEPLTWEKLEALGVIGLWADRQDEFGESAEWVRNLRRNEQMKNKLW